MITGGKMKQKLFTHGMIGFLLYYRSDIVWLTLFSSHIYLYREMKSVSIVSMPIIPISIKKISKKKSS